MLGFDGCAVEGRAGAPSCLSRASAPREVGLEPGAGSGGNFSSGSSGVSHTGISAPSSNLYLVGGVNGTIGAARRYRLVPWPATDGSKPLLPVGPDGDNCSPIRVVCCHAGRWLEFMEGAPGADPHRLTSESIDTGRWITLRATRPESSE